MKTSNIILLGYLILVTTGLIFTQRYVGSSSALSESAAQKLSQTQAEVCDGLKGIRLKACIYNVKKWEDKQ
jgi:hypothetical protein